MYSMSQERQSHSCLLYSNSTSISVKNVVIFGQLKVLNRVKTRRQIEGHINFVSTKVYTDDVSERAC